MKIQTINIENAKYMGYISYNGQGKGFDHFKNKIKEVNQLSLNGQDNEIDQTINDILNKEKASLSNALINV